MCQELSLARVNMVEVPTLYIFHKASDLKLESEANQLERNVSERFE
jgi:hypothetical protein